jgi:hypothetical protein
MAHGVIGVISSYRRHLWIAAGSTDDTDEKTMTQMAPNHLRHPVI